MDEIGSKPCPIVDAMDGFNGVSCMGDIPGSPGPETSTILNFQFHGKKISIFNFTNIYFKQQNILIQIKILALPPIGPPGKRPGGPALPGPI